MATDWRNKTARIPKGEGLPRTIEGLEIALDMRDELIQEQREEIARLKCKVNQLEQKRVKHD